MSSINPPPAPSSPLTAQKWVRAWSPPESLSTEVTTVPLSKSQRPLTWDTYLVQLSHRVAWLMREYGTPEEVMRLVDQMFLERLGRPFPWHNHRKPLAPQLVLSMETEEMLIQLHGLSPGQFPQTPKPQMQAMEALKETTLYGWLSLLLPTTSSD